MRRAADSKATEPAAVQRAPEDVAKMRTRAGLKDITNSVAAVPQGAGPLALKEVPRKVSLALGGGSLPLVHPLPFKPLHRH
jgi:hypothetical protein